MWVGGRSYVPLTALPREDDGYSRWLQSLLHDGSYFGDGRSHLFNFSVAGRARQGSGEAGRSGSVVVTAQVCARLEPEPDAATRAIQHASPYDKPVLAC